MSSGYGGAVGGLVTVLFAMVPLSALGLWKLAEIILWLIQNVSITVGAL